MLQRRCGISRNVIDPDDFAKVLKVCHELGYDTREFLEGLPQNLEVVFDLIRDFGRDTVLFCMKAHSDIEQLIIVDQIFEPITFYEPLKWWQKILKFRHIPFEQKTKGVEQNMRRMILPEDMITSILFQIQYWRKQEIRPTKLLISRDCYNEIGGHPDAWKFFEIGVPSSGKGPKVFGLDLVCDPFLKGNVYLVC